MACGVFKWRGVGLCVRLGWPIWLWHGAWHNSPSFCMACCREVAWKLGSIFADQHHWPPIVIAAFAHGLFLAFLCWVADLAIRRFVSDEATVRRTGFALLVTLFAGLLFFAWPLEDCP